LISSIWRPHSPVAQIAILYNQDIVATAIQRTKRLYQEEIDLRAIECAEDEGMIVHQDVTPNKQHTGSIPHGIA